MPVIEEDYVGFGIDKRTGKRHAINHLPKVAEWQEEIYQYEQKDKLIGGIDGIDNLQGQELANRTEYLKLQTDTHAEDIRKIKEEGIGGTEAITTQISIPATGWQEMIGDYPYYIDIPIEDATAEMIPMMTILPAFMGEAASCRICPACETVAGAVRVYTKTVPDTAIGASLTLFAPKGGGGSGAVPIATESTVGVVKIGEGLDIQSDGTLSVRLIDEEQAKHDVKEILDGDDVNGDTVDDEF